MSYDIYVFTRPRRYSTEGAKILAHFGDYLPCAFCQKAEADIFAVATDDEGRLLTVAQGDGTSLPAIMCEECLYRLAATGPTEYRAWKNTGTIGRLSDLPKWGELAS